MTSSIFLRRTGMYVCTALLLVVGLNLILNDFGLFNHREEVRIWTEEKTSKYLLSYHYIPQNFNGILIGPSVSVNMHTSDIDEFRIYNLSMNSGNITELKYAAEKALSSGRIRYLIICLYPYMTKDSGRKGRQIDEKEYFGSLYSILPVRLALARLKSVVKPGYDPFHSSTSGYHDTNLFKKDVAFANYIVSFRRKPITNIHIDPVAFSELADLIEHARLNGVKLFAYYYPIYSEFHDAYVNSGAWAKYQTAMESLFESGDIIFDMNTVEYSTINNNVAAYSDGHLSDYGAGLVIEEIEKKLKANNLSMKTN